jgi:lambda family phage portal protein
MGAVMGSVGRSYTAADNRDQYTTDSEVESLARVVAAVEAYKAARNTSQTVNWMPPHRSGDSAIASSWDRLTPRIRDLVKNDHGIRKASLALTRLVIGTGIQSFSAADEASEVLSPDDEKLRGMAERFEDESDFLFNYWAEHEADAVHSRSFWEIQRLAFKEASDTGNGIVLICNNPDPSRTVPLCLQVIESEQLDRTKDRTGGEGVNKIVGGIEYDWQTNRPVAYHIYDAHPYDDYSATAGGNSKRIDKSRVMHWFPIVDQASANSGVSWYVAMALASRDIDWYLGNELTAAAIAALFTVVYHAEKPWQQMLGLQEEDARLLGNVGPTPVRMGHANLATIGVNEKIDVVKNHRPNNASGEFIKLMNMRQAMSIDLSYIRQTGDLSATSYTAARAAHLEDDGMVKPLQQSFATTICGPTRHLWQSQAVALGTIKSVNVQTYRKNRMIFQSLDHLPVGREQLDPVNETEAATARMRSGQSTLKIENGRRGLHYKRTIGQMGREARLAAKKGVVLDYSKGNGGNLQTEGEAQPANNQETTESEGKE